MHSPTDASPPSLRTATHGLGPIGSLLLHRIGLAPTAHCRSPGALRNILYVIGYPPYHPTMMVDSRGAYSSRRIAQACEERVDFMAVTAMNQPDFRTIAKFRWHYLKALSVRLGLKLCHAAARLVKLGHVALDGSLSDLQYYDVAPVFGEANILLDHR